MHIPCWQGHDLDEMLDSESASYGWSQSCVSCKAQTDLSVTQHAKAFEGVCSRDLCAIEKAEW